MKIAFAVYLVLLSGCGRPGEFNNDDPTMLEYAFKSNAGLECVFVKNGTRGGLSCNWEKFNKGHIAIKKKKVVKCKRVRHGYFGRVECSL